jgi:hypothetical protein
LENTNRYIQERIERYGRTTMIESEFIFWKDSEMILKYLEIKSTFSIQEIPFLFSFYSIDRFLDLFQFTNNDKLSLIVKLRLSFNNEFEVDKEQKKEFDRNI